MEFLEIKPASVRYNDIQKTIHIKRVQFDKFAILCHSVTLQVFVEHLQFKSVFLGKQSMAAQIVQ